MKKAVKSSDLEVLPLFYPSAQLSRTPLINFNMTLRLLIYLRVNMSSLLLPLLSGTGCDSLVFRTKSRSWSIRLDKISQPSISLLPLPKLLLLAMLPWRSVNIASSQLSRRSSLRFRKVPILRKQQNADMRKSLSTWISGIRPVLVRVSTCEGR